MLSCDPNSVADGINRSVHGISRSADDINRVNRYVGQLTILVGQLTVIYLTSVCNTKDTKMIEIQRLQKFDWIQLQERR